MIHWISVDWVEWKSYIVHSTPPTQICIVYVYVLYVRMIVFYVLYWEIFMQNISTDFTKAFLYYFTWFLLQWGFKGPAHGPVLCNVHNVQYEYRSTHIKGIGQFIFLEIMHMGDKKLVFKADSVSSAKCTKKIKTFLYYSTYFQLQLLLGASCHYDNF